LELSQAVPVQLSTTFQVREMAEAVIDAKGFVPFEQLWEGPVATVRSAFGFMTEMRLLVHGVRAAYGRQRRWCRLLGFGEAGRRPRQLPDHPVRQFLFTARGLTDPSWPKVLGRWATIRDELHSVLALYSAATMELTLHAELRFLALAQALETYHRTRFKETVLPRDQHRERKRRVLAALAPADRDWVTPALAWSNELTLRQRLQRLYEKVPRPLVDHLPQIGTLVQEIADTRNYLTHFGERKPDVLSGFRLSETTDNMRHVLQYLLLLELGFSENDATGIAHRSFIRDLSRSRVLRFMGTT